MINVAFDISTILQSNIQVKQVEPNINRKGKGKMDQSDDPGLPYFPQLPSFDLGVGSTQPDVLHSQEIQKHVDSVIFEVVTATKNVDSEVFTKTCRRHFIFWIFNIITVHKLSTACTNNI
jgi:hypothetical protein